MNTLIKIFDLTTIGAEEQVNTFLASGIQLMQDGMTIYPDKAIFIYREKGVLGSPTHTQLNQINNEIQNAQKKILATLGQIDEVDIRIADHRGTEESKNDLKASRDMKIADLEFNKKVIVKLKSMYAAVENGSIDTLNG